MIQEDDLNLVINKKGQIGYVVNNRMVIPATSLQNEFWNDRFDSNRWRAIEKDELAYLKTQIIIFFESKLMYHNPWHEDVDGNKMILELYEFFKDFKKSGGDVTEQMIAEFLSLEE